VKVFEGVEGDLANTTLDKSDDLEHTLLLE
jgi:hypothetical protein